MANPEKGNIVKSKITGIKMTVSQIALNNYCICVYFIESELKTVLYSFEDLDVISD